MSRAGVAGAALLVALAFGASYALSAESGDEKSPGVEVPGKPASPLKVSEAGLRTALLGSATQIPGTLNRDPVKRKAAAAPAPAPAPTPAPTPAPEPTPAPAPAPTPAPAPAPTPAPAPAPNPDDGTGQTFDDSG
jgi:outer membrane biosynthesis protein TonB